MFATATTRTNLFMITVFSFYSGRWYTPNLGYISRCDARVVSTPRVCWSIVKKLSLAWKAKIDSLWCWGNCSIYVGMQFRVIYSCTYLFTQHKILAWFHEVSGKVPVQSHPGRRGCAACVRACVRSPVFEKQSNVYRKSSKRPLSWQHAKKMGQLKSEQRSSLDSPLSAYFGAEFDARVGPPI